MPMSVSLVFDLDITPPSLRQSLVQAFLPLLPHAGMKEEHLWAMEGPWLWHPQGWKMYQKQQTNKMPGDDTADSPLWLQAKPLLVYAPSLFHCCCCWEKMSMPKKLEVCNARTLHSPCHVSLLQLHLSLYSCSHCISQLLQITEIHFFSQDMFNFPSSQENKMKKLDIFQ